MKKGLILGGAGYIGSRLATFLPDFEVATRKTWKDYIGEEFDIILNAATPSQRFRAEKEPTWDFNETVFKTHDFLTLFSYKKFIQISSISARSQLDSYYGRHKKSAESLLSPSDLIIRLTATYNDSLKKGVIFDIIKNNPIYLAPRSSYSFAPLDYVAGEIVKNLDKTGILEIGGKDKIFLDELCNATSQFCDFRSDYLDTQVVDYKKDAPGVKECIEFIKKLKRKRNYGNHGIS